MPKTARMFARRRSRRLDARVLTARRFGLAACLAALSLMSMPADAAARALTIFAAASLTNAVQELADDFTRSTGIVVKTSFAASSALARQIASGAPAEVFISADNEWMDYLQAHGLIRAGTRRNLVGNSLVLIAPADSGIRLAIAPHFALAAALGGGRLAIGDPDSVPIGRYGRAALTSLGVWKDVADRLARADNVRMALAYVARGEAPLGIVYRTDALIEKKVRIVGVFPAATHPPVVYPAALTTAAGGDARKFLDYLGSAAGDAAFVKYGFTPLH